MLQRSLQSLTHVRAGCCQTRGCGPSLTRRSSDAWRMRAVKCECGSWRATPHARPSMLARTCSDSCAAHAARAHGGRWTGGFRGFAAGAATGYLSYFVLGELAWPWIVYLSSAPLMWSRVALCRRRRSMGEAGVVAEETHAADGAQYVRMLPRLLVRREFVFVRRHTSLAHA